MAFDKAKAIRAAEKHLAQGKVPAAIEEYRKIVEHDQDDFTCLNTLGDLYVRTGKQQEAVACFKRVADHYRVQGFALKAIAMYKKVTRYVPDEVNVSVVLASLYEQQGLHVEARAQYLMVGDLLARRGNTREALEVLQRVADLDPNNTDIRLRLAESFARENIPDLAAEAYTEAGDRLSSRGDYERALDTYTRALKLQPHSHAALQGMLTAHAALGTADEAAEILEQAIASKPGDLELRAMLVRAYVESENAQESARVASELVNLDPTSYAYFFEVARLFLRQKETERALALVGRIAETALTGREDNQLLEILEESLRRDPEHIGALLLLVRIYEWQRNDALLRTALDRLAEAAEASGAEEEERKALTQLLRIGADEARYRTRLEKLGGAQEFEEEREETAAQSFGATGEVPTFESFMMPDETAAPAPAAEVSGTQPSAEFTWETFQQQSEASDPSHSFADLNTEFNDAVKTPAPPPSFESFQEVSFGASNADAAQATESPDEALARALRQELESVDFYLAQGYTDIARDTLDMLERQYGASPQIDERRLRASSQQSAAPFAEPSASVEAQALDDVDAAFASMATGPASAGIDSQQQANAAGFTPAQVAQETQTDSSSTSRGAGLDAGLAAIFDEFREAIEDSEPEAEADFDTHYNLGLAYKDIEMYDQAVEAFQSAIQSVAPGDQTPRYLHCCNMLGHCFMQKGMPKLAAMWFRRGLDAPGHTEDEYQALRYELADAYEQMGDTERAIDIFTEVYGIDVTYRGVAERLRELQEQKAVTSDK